MIIESSDFLSTAIIVTDTSIKNDIVISISHMHIYNNHDGISKIIIVTNSIHMAKKIFDLSLHPF